MDKTLEYNLITIKRLLIVFTILHPIYFLITLYYGFDTPWLDFSFGFITFSIYVVYIMFIWSISEMSRFDKIKESILTLFFGIIAMWVWVQFNDIKKS